MKMLVNSISRLARKVTVPCLAVGAALFLAGCSSTGGTSSGRSIAELKSAAEKGDPQAQMALGDAYYNGRGVQRSYTEAQMWYDKAAANYRAKAK